MIVRVLVVVGVPAAAVARAPVVAAVLAVSHRAPRVQARDPAVAPGQVREREVVLARVVAAVVDQDREAVAARALPMGTDLGVAQGPAAVQVRVPDRAADQVVAPAAVRAAVQEPDPAVDRELVQAVAPVQVREVAPVQGVARAVLQDRGAVRDQVAARVLARTAAVVVRRQLI